MAPPRKPETKEGYVPPESDQIAPDSLIEARPDRDAAYWRRMLFIQKWRRVVLLVCLLLCVDAVVTLCLDPHLAQTSHIVLVQSLFAFGIALIFAGNFLTFRARK
jgi:hypothetical protein